MSTPRWPTTVAVAAASVEPTDRVPVPTTGLGTSVTADEPGFDCRRPLPNKSGLCDGQDAVQLWRQTPQDHPPAVLPHAAVDVDEQRDPGSVETLALGEVDQQVRGPCRNRIVQYAAGGCHAGRVEWFADPDHQERHCPGRSHGPHGRLPDSKTSSIPASST